MSPSVAEAFAELLRADATAAVAWTASGTVSRGDLDQRARAIAELSGGRLMLGLGMSHRQMLASLGIDMGNGQPSFVCQIVLVRNHG